MLTKALRSVIATGEFEVCVVGVCSAFPFIFLSLGRSKGKKWKLINPENIHMPFLSKRGEVNFTRLLDGWGVLKPLTL